MDYTLTVYTQEDGQTMTLNKIQNFNSSLIISHMKDNQISVGSSVSFDVHFAKDADKSVKGPSGHYAMTVEKRDGRTQRLSLITDVKVY